MTAVVDSCNMKANSPPAKACFAISVTSWWRDRGYMYKFMKQSRETLLQSVPLWYKFKALPEGDTLSGRI